MGFIVNNTTVLIFFTPMHCF